MTGLNFALTWEKFKRCFDLNPPTAAPQQVDLTQSIRSLGTLLASPIMTLTNGDSAGHSVHPMTDSKVLNYTTALEILHDSPESQDGIDAETLLDSKRRGGLTYNDFLVLPGYIGQQDFVALYDAPLTYSRLCCLKCRPGYARDKANHSQNSSRVIAYGHCH